MKINKMVKLVKFLIKKPILGFTIDDVPWFGSDEAVKYFENLVRKSKYFVEFGSGGSTVLAAKLGATFSTVDSDRIFLDAVKQKILKNGLLNNEKQYFHYADIGFTGPLGKPVAFFPPDQQRLAAYRRYSDLPPAPNGTHQLPDLVLVDGRFRVACALKTIQQLIHAEGWTLIIDDYIKRPSYSIVEEFADKITMAGRMAIFSKKKDIDKKALEAAVQQYEIIPD